MPSAQKLFSLLALACAATLLISGCGNGYGNNVNPNTVISVVVYPGTGNAKAAPNGTINFTATVYNFTANGGVTWKAASGTITNSTANTATYQAPAMGSSDTVTATSLEDTTKSFSVTVNITAAQAITISPVSVTVLAGATQQFTATGGGGAVTWSLPPPGPGQNFGTIDPNTGLYTAPPSPPAGGIVVITATFGASNGTATVTILYSNASLCNQCKYVFSYSGEDATNGFFLASAGNLLTDGMGNIVADGHSFVDLNEGAGDTMANVTGGNYTIGPDGRGTLNVITSQGTFILQVSVSSPQQALVVRFDTLATGSGTMDLANVADFSGIADGNYAFGVSGVDSGGFSMAIAGRFLSSGGTFPLNDAIQDANDAGTVTQADISLHGNVVSFDSASGRGTLEFQSTAVKPNTLNFAFYIVDDTHLKLVEIDQTPVLAGDAFGAPAIITDASLQASNYAFTLGGSSTGGPFASGGIFKSSGTGTIGGGDLDSVTNGAVRTGSISSTSTYSVTPLNSNRILMSMITGNTTLQFGVYPTSNGTAEMVEVDTFFVSGGQAFAQSSTTTPQGSFSFNLTGVSGNLEQDYVGTIATMGANNLGGYLDVNVTGSIFGNTPLATNSTINAPDSFGRGTTTLLTTPPTSATIGLNYYTISNSQALVLEVDGLATTVGVMGKQF
jgi:hypothetical protein